MVSIFFRIFIFYEKRKILSHFLQKTEKKPQKIPLKKLVKIAFFSTNFAENFNFWLVKISGHGFSSFFAIIFKCNVLEHAKSATKLCENHQIWQKMKKTDFLFFVTHFSLKNENFRFSLEIITLHVVLSIYFHMI